MPAASWASPDPRRWRRRAVSLSLLAVAAGLAPLIGPPVLVGAALLDVILQRGTRARAVAFVLLYIACQSVGVVGCAAVWLRHRGDPAAFRTANHVLQERWASTLLGGLMRLFRMKISLTGEAQPERGPYLLLVRHVSSADTLLPMIAIALRHHLRTRYVMKAELLWDPCLDLVGQRVPNTFVRRGGADPEGAAARLGALCRDLDPDEIVVLYPEGTRFTAARRQRALDRLSDQPDVQARARALTRTLLPRTRGVAAMRSAAPDLDVVVLGHSGLQGVRGMSDLTGGALLDRTVHLRAWRTPGDAVPTTAADLDPWLFDQWRRLEEWLATVEPAPP